MMGSEPCKEDPNVNIVLRSENAIGDDNGKQPKESTWVRKSLTKEAKFDLKCAHKTFMEAKKSFVETYTSGSKDKLDQEVDPSMLKNFL